MESRSRHGGGGVASIIWGIWRAPATAQSGVPSPTRLAWSPAPVSHGCVYKPERVLAQIFAAPSNSVLELDSVALALPGSRPISPQEDQIASMSPPSKVDDLEKDTISMTSAVVEDQRELLVLSREGPCATYTS